MTALHREADDIALPDSEDEDEYFNDDNTCTDQEIEKLFQCKCKILDEQATTLKNHYVLSLCTDSYFTSLVAGLSDGNVNIFDVSSQRGLQHVDSRFINPPFETRPNVVHTICGLRFLDETNRLLLVGTSDGFVRVYDMRAQKQVKYFSSGPEHNITCFDINANGRVLCTGTSQHKNETQLIFYDIRQGECVGRFCESHQDDITCVRFHAEHPDLLCTGSTDGLINAFDIHKTKEERALQTTINTESSVYKLNLHKGVDKQVLISCLTHTNDFKIFDCEEGDEIVAFDRSSITAAIKRKNPGNCNLINAHTSADDNIFLLVGTNYKKGEIMRTLSLQNKQITPLADFEDNKQIVRESVFDQNHNILVTGGESGIVSLWSTHGLEGAVVNNSDSMKLKVKSRMNSHKKTPY